MHKYNVILPYPMPRQSGIQKKEGKREIEPSRVKEKVDKGEDVYILDVRTPEEYESWRISYDKHQNPPLIPIDKFFNSPSEVAKQIPKDKEIVTVCAHGNRSAMAASLLSQMGYNVKSMAGGMAGWNTVYDIAPVPLAKDSPVRIWQVRRVSKGCVGYVIAPSSSSSRDATVIDPTCDIDQSFMKVARDNDLAISKVIDTHLHADHVSGLAKLAKEVGALPYVSSLEGYQFDENSKIANPRYVPDGDIIEVADGVFLAAIHTPGHTEGSMSFALKMGNGKTHLFTGDTIFVDGIGRPDLRDRAEEFANNLYHTYHEKILKLPDDTVILSAHVSSSITLKHGEPVYDTLGSIKKNVELLSMSRDEFVKFVLDTVPPKPANYRKIIDINRGMVPCDRIEMGDLEAGPNSCAIPAR